MSKSVVTQQIFLLQKVYQSTADNMDNRVQQITAVFSKLLQFGWTLAAFTFIFSVAYKGSFISETFDNFNQLKHQWPKIWANLNSLIGRKIFLRSKFKLSGILGQWWFKWSKLSKVSEIKLTLTEWLWPQHSFTRFPYCAALVHWSKMKK